MLHFRAYASACYYALDLVEALGWMCCVYATCVNWKPSDGPLWTRFCLTFLPIINHGAITGAVATELLSPQTTAPTTKPPVT